MSLKKFGVKIGQFTQESPFETLFILLFILLVIILSSLYLSVDFDEEHWEEFKAQQHCQLRTTKTGTQRASWICDNGKTYFRWRQQR